MRRRRAKKKDVSPPLPSEEDGVIFAAQTFIFARGGGGGGPPRPMGNKSLLRASVSFFRIRSDSCAFFSSFSYDTVNKDRRSALEDPFGPRTKANCAFALFFAPSSYVSTHTAENEDTVLRTYRTYDSRLPEKEFPALLC